MFHQYYLMRLGTEQQHPDGRTHHFPRVPGVVRLIN